MPKVILGRTLTSAGVGLIGDPLHGMVYARVSSRDILKKATAYFAKESLRGTRS